MNTQPNTPNNTQDISGISGISGETFTKEEVLQLLITMNKNQEESNKNKEDSMKTMNKNQEEFNKNIIYGL